MHGTREVLATSPMTEAVRRHSFDATRLETSGMDATGLQALAAAAVSAPPEAVADAAARRNSEA